MVVERDAADEVSYGADRARPLWPRGWVAATAVIACTTAALGWRLHSAPTPRAAVPVSPTPTVSPSPTASPTPEPTAFAGPVLRDDVGAEVLIGGALPTVVDLTSGRQTEITGIPDGYEVGSAVRIRGATMLAAGFAEAGTPSPVFRLADGTTAARPIPARAWSISPAESERSFWAHLQTGVESPTTVEERTAAGALLRRATLPRDWALVRGVRGGLLVARFEPGNGRVRSAVWDPARRRFVRSVGFGGLPVAATRTHLAWPDPTCERREFCILHVTHLSSGADRLIPLPRDYSPMSGAFNSDGSALVLSMLERSRDVAQVFLVAPESGQVMPLRGATSEPSVMTVGWTPDDEAVVLSGIERSFATSLAVWRRSAPTIELVPDGVGGSYHAVAVRPGG